MTYQVNGRQFVAYPAVDTPRSILKAVTPWWRTLPE
jgi:hypothetical protein